jgi:arsenate reductase
MRLPLRILVLCTANSARSQIAEALFRARGGERVEVASAGSKPAEKVDPNALRVLGAHGIPVEEPRPKRTEEVLGLGWDVVITVCDHARDTCPVLPGATLAVHWGMADPAGTSDEERAFEEAFQILSGRIDRLLASVRVGPSI